MHHACVVAYLIVSIIFYGIFVAMSLWKQQRESAVFWGIALAMPLSLLFFGV